MSQSAHWTQRWSSPFALQLLLLYRWGVDGIEASEQLLERRDGGSNSVCWTQGIVLRLGWGEADVGTVGGAATRTVRQVGSELYIVVASSSEYLRLFIKWRGLREGDTAATVRFSTKPQ